MKVARFKDLHFLSCCCHRGRCSQILMLMRGPLHFLYEIASKEKSASECNIFNLWRCYAFAISSSGRKSIWDLLKHFPNATHQKRYFPNLAKHCLKEMLRKVVLGMLLCPRLRKYVYYYSTHHNPILQSCLTKKMLKDH